jgi:hypothetical protein
MRCTKCDVEHEVDTNQIGWSTMCEACRPAWGIKQRSWMAEKMKEQKKRKQRSKRNG